MDSEANKLRAKEYGYMEMWLHALLSVLVLLIWAPIWVYKVTKATNKLDHSQNRTPTGAMLLSIFVPFYWVFWQYTIANMLDEVGIHCNIQQVDGATNSQYMKDGTWEGLMLHFATIAPDLGLYMGRHLDKNGAYYAKGIQHPDKEMELLEEIRRCMDPDEKHKLEKELQAAIYDAEDGSCLFGRVLYVNKSSMYKYDYVIDDHATEAFTACWDLSACWLNK